jgi:hypothetical protein
VLVYTGKQLLANLEGVRGKNENSVTGILEVAGKLSKTAKGAGIFTRPTSV